MNKRRNPLLVLAATLVGMSISSTAFAGSLGSYQLVTLLQFASSTSGTIVIAHFDADLTGRPSCASGSPNAVAFDVSTERGKTAFALLQGAMLSGKRVRVTGTNACTLHSSTENLGWLGAAD
jgi:hypothetical protein